MNLISICPQSYLFSTGARGRIHPPSRVVCDVTMRGRREEMYGLEVGGGPLEAMKDCKRGVRESLPREGVRWPKERSIELFCSSTLWSPSPRGGPRRSSL